jgi:hypothetical protein
MAKKFVRFLFCDNNCDFDCDISKIANYLPMALQKDTMRKYKSIKEVKSKLNIRDVYIPSYFPQILWPPSTILAQDKPFVAIILEVNRTEKGISLSSYPRALPHISP